MNRLIKERYYVTYIVSDNDISADTVIDIMISWVFRLYKLSASIVFDRGP